MHMDISLLLILAGVLTLWAIGLAVITVSMSNIAARNGFPSEAADTIGGVWAIVYLAVSSIALGLYL